MTGRRTTDSTNELYKPLTHVEIAGYQYQIYGSMSWTVAETRKIPWETLREAYVELTGDTRDVVNRDAAINVVAGHLQFTWAELKNRPDLLPTLQDNQKRRIEMAITSTQPVPKERAKKQPKTTGAGVSTDNTSTAETAPESTKAKTIPTRGAMGKAAELIKAGNTDGRAIEAEVSKAYPQMKNGARHIRYVAKLLGATLVWSKDAPPDATTAPTA